MIKLWREIRDGGVSEEDGGGGSVFINYNGGEI